MKSRMYEEICEQPATLARTLKFELRRMERLKKVLAQRPPRLIVLVARGTSDNAAQFARYLIEISTGIPVSLAAPSVFTLYNTDIDYRGALVIAISQSGESTDINVVLERARARGALTIGVTNEPKSEMAKLAAHTFLVRAGKEKSVAATKTYTGQMMILYLIAHALGGKIPIADLERIPLWTAAALRLAPAIEELAQRYRFMDYAVVVGRGLNYANAFEFALKMMETCYVVAERFSSADFLHGPIALVERGFPLFLFAASGPTWPTMKEMLEKLRQLKADTLIVTDRENGEAPAMAGRSLVIPARIPEMFTPIPYIVPAQLFAAALAREKGLDPDRPRTLTKVTQTL